MMALVEIVLNTGDNCFCHVSRQAKEFYRRTKEIRLIVYNFTESMITPSRTAALTGFPRSWNGDYLHTVLYLL